MSNVFTEIVELPTVRPSLNAMPDQIIVMASPDRPPRPMRISVAERCGPIAWRADADQDWLQVTAGPTYVDVAFDITALSLGTHTGVVTLLPDSPEAMAAKCP
ncbi:MAG: hypothetical protein Q9O62_12610 [Ardenticatenia bacterium]|nr:hypothetical protein [Ardenticatenia bacterium]